MSRSIDDIERDLSLARIRTNGHDRHVADCERLYAELLSARERAFYNSEEGRRYCAMGGVSGLSFGGPA